MMKNSKLFTLRSLWMALFICSLNFATPIISMAQPKIQSLNEIENKVKDSATSFGNMAKYVIGAVLFIALVGVIYMVATSHPKSKEAVIGWLVAVVFYVIAISVL